MNIASCNGVTAKLTWACIHCLCLLVAMLPVAAFAQPAETPRQTHDVRLLFSADELWNKVLQLLSEHEGYISKTRVEEVFGVRFAHSDEGVDEKRYWVNDGTEGFFRVSEIEYGKHFKMPGDPERNGPLVAMHISWNRDSFNDSHSGRCITAIRVQSDLVAAGWTPPGRWGLIDDSIPNQKVIDEQRKCTQAVGSTCSPQGPPLEDFQVMDTAFFRRPHKSELPEIKVSAPGGRASSCLYEITVQAHPPA